MGASTGNMLVDDPKTLEGIFAEARVPIATHCEYSPLILENEKRYRERYGDAVPIEAHPLIRSAEACYRSSSMAVDLAKRHGARLHVLHLTTARELELFEPGPDRGQANHRGGLHAPPMVRPIELCRCSARRSSAIPPSRPAPTELRCVRPCSDDRIDVIATDHAPHTLEEKARGYFEAPSGLPLVQHSLLMLLDQHADGLYSLAEDRGEGGP